MKRKFKKKFSHKKIKGIQEERRKKQKRKFRKCSHQLIKRKNASSIIEDPVLKELFVLIVILLFLMSLRYILYDFRNYANFTYLAHAPRENNAPILIIPKDILVSSFIFNNYAEIQMKTVDFLMKILILTF